MLAPADDDTPLPPYVVSAGRAVPVPYNGSVARLNFGFLSAARVRRWLHDGNFDVDPHPRAGLPVARPAGLLGGAGTDRGHLPHLEPALPRDDRRVPDPAARAGEDQRPDRGQRVRPAHRWSSTSAATRSSSRTASTSTSSPAPSPTPTGRASPTIGFIGRIDEPRKGLPVLMAALPEISPRPPDARLLVAGRGRRGGGRRGAARASCAPRVEFLGMVTDEDKARLLRSVDVYVRPEHRRRELRHHPRRGDVGGRAGPRLRPGRLRAGPGPGRGGRPVRQRGPARRWPRAADRLLRDPPRRRARGARRGSGPRTALRLVDGRRGHPGRLRDGDGRRPCAGVRRARGRRRPRC